MWNKYYNEYRILDILHIFDYYVNSVDFCTFKFPISA